MGFLSFYLCYQNVIKNTPFGLDNVSPIHYSLIIDENKKERQKCQSLIV